MFHAITQRWFTERYGVPTLPQERGWPAIAQGDATLIAAPTGSGKTLAAFLVCIDRLLRKALAGELEDQTQVVYVSPLKALSHDVRRNLSVPLAEIRERAREAGHELPEIRVAVRTGDTPAHQRQAMLRRPPHILVTTPESLFLMITSQKSREIFRTVDTVIVDEIHALVRDKRGSHPALSLARLDRIAARKPVRIGLSATQKPLETVAAYLTGATDAPCTIVDAGHRRHLDLGIEVPKSELSAVCSNEHWDEIYDRLKELISQHRSTLIFVNTRKLAERVAFHLAAALGEEHVASHHGSLSRQRRLAAEEKLKHGELKAIVATASLELGIDVGHVDLVCQIGSPRSIATFLQRIGRAGHAISATPKGRLFALTRDELVESLALLRATKAGELDRLVVPQAPLDILAQQAIALATDEELSEDEMFSVVRAAYPYRNLTRAAFDDVLSMLENGYAEGRRQFAPLVRDRIQGKVRAKPGARMTALMAGGAIPEQGDYRVVTEGDGAFVGTINEDFAIESSAGDVFLLGSTSWQIAAVKASEVVVRDAHGAPPTIPFWLGEAPGRTIELSGAVSELREGLDARLDLKGQESDPLFSLEALAAIAALDPEQYKPARAWLEAETGANPWTTLQAVHYAAAQKASIGLLPTQEKVVFERFFDDSGGMQLVIHAPFGIRINKAFGLALRKRFCRSFDFELQASADNDGIVLSLGPHQSFPIEQLFRMLSSSNAEALLVQALLAVPLFQIRWRWNAGRALAVPRAVKGKAVPAPLQRFRAEDLLTACFPAQTQCKEHVVGDIEIPDHPLVKQTVADCLNEAMDLEGFLGVLRRIEAGEITLLARDTREPSPFSYQLLNAYPYAFLDDAPLEERRARAIVQRRTLPLGDLADLGRLDAEVIGVVSRQAWPTARRPDELHEAMMALGVLPEAEAEASWHAHRDVLVAQGRLGIVEPRRGLRLWFATERLPVIDSAYAGAHFPLKPKLPPALARSLEPHDACRELIKGYAEHKGVTTAAAVAEALALDLGTVEATLPAIEGTGTLVRGRFLLDVEGIQWCERRLLQRIHRLTLDGLRRQIQPVPAETFMQFLLERHRLTPGLPRQGKEGLLETLAALQGFDAPAGAWESDILPTRVGDYQAGWLDELMHVGIASWGRLTPPARAEDDGPMMQGMSRTAPIALLLREDLPWLLPPARVAPLEAARPATRAVYDVLVKYGAQFASELRQRAGLLESALDDALGELTRLGLIHADGFAALRPFVSKNKKTQSRLGLPSRFAGRGATYSLGGRWSAFPPPGFVPEREDYEEWRAERWADLLLTRYGVVFRDLLQRESAAPEWWRVARALRQREARGDVRGGRFVAGDLGEQYGLPEAVEDLRRVKKDGAKGSLAVLAAGDPLNLTGILVEERIGASRNAAIAYLDGKVVAVRDGSDVDVVFKAGVPLAQEMAITKALRLNGVFRARVAAMATP